MSNTMTDTVPLPPCDPAQCIPYQSIRYINGYAESYVHQFARTYAAAVSAADNAALRAEIAAINQAADVVEAAYRKRVEELEAASQWRPIETAPKDREILVWFATLFQGRAEIGRWDTDRYAKKPRPYWSGIGVHVYGVAAYRQGTPTHWMPLPSQPKEPKHG